MCAPPSARHRGPGRASRASWKDPPPSRYGLQELPSLAVWALTFFGHETDEAAPHLHPGRLDLARAGWCPSADTQEVMSAPRPGEPAPSMSLCHLLSSCSQAGCTARPRQVWTVLMGAICGGTCGVARGSLRAPGSRSPTPGQRSCQGPAPPLLREHGGRAAQAFLGHLGFRA